MSLIVVVIDSLLIIWEYKNKTGISLLERKSDLDIKVEFILFLDSFFIVDFLYLE